MSKFQWLDWAKKMQAIAQSGLTYTKCEFERERYTELRNLSFEIMNSYSNFDMQALEILFENDRGYATPKVDVRGVVFQANAATGVDEILMVLEKMDNRWALPGGWADVGLSPKEVAVKEVKEEAGFDVEPVRLMGVMDKKRHGHPPSPFYIYKIFIQCEITGGKAEAGSETLDARFFPVNALPELSENRITEAQIQMLHEHYQDPALPAYFD